MAELNEKKRDLDLYNASLSNAQAQLQSERAQLHEVRGEAARHELDSHRHNRTITYLRSRDTQLKTRLEDALAAISEASVGLEATPFPPPPPLKHANHIL